MPRVLGRIGLSPSLQAGTRGLLLAVVLVALALATSCGGSSGDAAQKSASPTPSPISIASGQLSGKRSETVDLGEHRLGKDVWLAWVLTGPEDARAKFSLILRSSDSEPGASTTIGPASFGARLISHRALPMSDIGPGSFRVFVRQAVEPRSSGYSGKFEVFTSP